MKISAKRLLAITGIGVAVATPVAFGAWGLIHLFAKDKAIAGTGALQEYDFAEKDANGNVLRQIEGLKIGQYETLMPDKRTYEYYLNQEGINYFVKRFFEAGMFGPEVFGLKKIWIGNNFLTTSKENGLYTPQTNEIGLNAENDAKRLRDASLIGDQKLRAELLFQTFIHEYNHHFAYSYFSSPYKALKQNVYDDKQANIWNSAFINKFKEDLNYKQNPNAVNPIPNTPEDPKDINSTYKYAYCVGGAYQAKELWDGANTQQGSLTIPADSIYRWWYRKTTSKATYFSNYTYVDSATSLKYYYSQEELFARKTLLMTLTADPVTFSDLILKRVRNDLFEEQERIQTNFALDDKGQPNVAIDKMPQGDQFLFDDPFGTVTKEDKTTVTASQDLVEEIDKQIGHATGSDISFVWNRNDYMVSDSSTIASPTNPSSYKNQVKFGGYIDDKNLTHVGYMDKGQFIPLSKINVVPFNLGYKATPFASKRTSVGGEQFSYATKDYISKDTLVNKPLYFATQSKDASNNITWGTPVALTTFRGQTDADSIGVASNYLEHLPETVRTKSGINYEYIVPSLKTNEVVLTREYNSSEWGGA